MTKSSLSASDEEKSGVVEKPSRSGGFFSRKKPVEPPSANDDKEANGEVEEEEVQPKAVEQEVKTVSFSGLFR